MKKSFWKMMLTTALAACLILSSVTSAFACTGLYVGSGVTENGSSYMGRSEDIGDRYGKVFGVAEPQTITADSVFKDTYGFTMKYSDLEFDYPETTYSYTYVRDSYLYGETMKDADGNFVGEAYAEAGQNEKGVSMTATVSTSNNSAAKTADPLTYNPRKGIFGGICEVSMTSILLGGAATAKEAVDLLAEIIDKYGSGECNSIMIADANETWYFEIVSGHQYAAVKLPDNKVSVQPNIMLLGVIDVTDTENVVVSDGLVSLAQENGFLVTDESGKIDVTATYGTPSGTSKRYWQGLFYFNEEAANAYTDADGKLANSTKFDYDLLFDTTKTLTTMDVLNLLAFRGENSAWDYSGEPNQSNGNVIGTRSQSECHIFETRPNMPGELAVLQWQCMADAEFGIYIPYYSALVTDVSELYDTEVIPKYLNVLTGELAENVEEMLENDWMPKELAGELANALAEETEGQINTNFHLINYLCDMNRKTDPEVGAAVKAYFETYQQSLIDQQKLVDEAMKVIYAADPAIAKATATQLGKHLAKQASDISSAVLAELRAWFSEEEHAAPFALSEAVTSVMPVYAEVTHDMQETFDANAHWLACTVCGAATEAVAHKIDTLCDANGHWDVCSDCEYITESAAHTMEPAFDADNHWTECGSCDYATEAVAHTMGPAFDADNHWTECSSCDYATETVAHELDTLCDANGHWNICGNCEYITEPVVHTMKNAADAKNHWTECDSCDYATEAAAHEFVKGVCACGQTEAPKTGDMTPVTLLGTMMILSMLAAAALVIKTKKQKA